MVARRRRHRLPRSRQQRAARTGRGVESLRNVVSPASGSAGVDTSVRSPDSPREGLPAATGPDPPRAARHGLFRPLGRPVAPHGCLPGVVAATEDRRPGARPQLAQGLTSGRPAAHLGVAGVRARRRILGTSGGRRPAGRAIGGKSPVHSSTTADVAARTPATHFPVAVSTYTYDPPPRGASRVTVGNQSSPRTTRNGARDLERVHPGSPRMR